MRAVRFRFSLKECRGIRTAVGTVREIVDEVERTKNEGKEKPEDLLGRGSGVSEADEGEKERGNAEEHPGQCK